MAKIALSNIDLPATSAAKDNTGGLVPRLIFGYWDDVAVFPELPTDTEGGLSLDAAGVWVGDVVMKTGKNAFVFDFTEDTGELKISDQGEIGGESFLYDLTIIRAKMSKKLFGLENATKGEKMFFIVQDNNGTYYLLGDKRLAAKKVSGDGSTSGANPTTRNQNALHFTYTCPRKLVYEGDVDDILLPAASGT